jgi:hypothetical protein
MTKIGTSQNTQRQDSESASQPAMSGPTMDGTIQAADSRENAFGRSSSGNARAMTT